MAITSQRNRSKSTRTYIACFHETREQHAGRIAATKKNSKKKRLQAQHAKPKETPVLKASNIVAAKEAARKIFEKWLANPDVTKLAEKGKYTYENKNYYFNLPAVLGRILDGTVEEHIKPILERK